MSGVHEQDVQEWKWNIILLFNLIGKWCTRVKCTCRDVN